MTVKMVSQLLTLGLFYSTEPVVMCNKTLTNPDLCTYLALQLSTPTYCWSSAGEKWVITYCYTLSHSFINFEKGCKSFLRGLAFWSFTCQVMRSFTICEWPLKGAVLHHVTVVILSNFSFWHICKFKTQHSFDFTQGDNISEAFKNFSKWKKIQ